MIRIGNFNRLMILERSQGKVFLDGGEDGQVILSNREAPPECQVGEMLNVFVYTDADSDSLLATVQRPFVTVGEFAHLEVASLERIGAFLDWGLPKQLFLPFREQTRELQIGHKAIVYLYLDSTRRISASMRIDKHLNKNPRDYFYGQKVDLLIFGATDLGFKAIVNGRHLGLLYGNEIFQPISIGQSIGGFIQNIREDGKLDLSLQQAGYRGVDEISQKILDILEKKGGFLAMTDRSSAEEIYQVFNMSKKKYKMAVGNLYKKRLIHIDETGIRLSKKTS